MVETFYSKINDYGCAALKDGGKCLDCGAQQGDTYVSIRRKIELPPERYFVIEWNHASILAGRMRGLSIVRGDLNAPLPWDHRSFDCAFGLSVRR